jgi:hypothetical protein
MHEVFRVARLCYGRGKGMGSRATEKMRSEMMQAREKGLMLVKVWEWKKGSSKDLWVGKLPQGGNCRGSRCKDSRYVIMSCCRNLMMRECGGARSLNYANQELG